jgi:dTDP-4-dehydrorhamnose reductase
MSSSTPRHTPRSTKPRANPNFARAPSMPWPLACWPKSRPNSVRWLVHYSTDYVFNGSGSTPWVESRCHRPVQRIRSQTNSKESSCHYCRPTRCKHLILQNQLGLRRSRWQLCQDHAASLAQEREQTHRHQRPDRCPPPGADLLADVTAHAIRPGAAARRAGGHHRRHLPPAWRVVRPAGMTTPDTSLQAAQQPHSLRLVIKASDIAARAHQRLPHPGQTTAQLTPEHRPNCRRTFGLTLPHWQVGVNRMLAEIL